MTNLNSSLALDARTVLFGSGNAALAGLREVVMSGPAGDRIRANLGNLSPATATAAAHRIATEMNRLLDVDVLTVLSAAWLKYQELLEAAHRTLAKPTSEEIVELATQSVGWELCPQIDLWIDSTCVATITLTLRYEMNLDLPVVKVERGAITEIRAGMCQGTLTLAVDERTAARRSIKLNLAGTISPGRPIALVKSNTTGLEPRRRSARNLSPRIRW